MQISYKRNGLKNNMIVRNDRNDPQSLREKMIARNSIKYLAKMTPQRIDDICYYYYDIQGRVNLASMFAGRIMTKSEINAILSGVAGLLTELQRYLLSTDDVLFSPSEIWILPDTLEPSFIYVPGLIPEEKYSIHAFAEFLTEHVDSSDRDAAAAAYSYLSNVEAGCILPRSDLLEETVSADSSSADSISEGRIDEPPIDPEEYWDLKESVSDEMKPLFEESEGKQVNVKMKTASLLLLVFAMAAAGIYILSVINPSLLPVYLTDEEYMVTGVIIAIVFAIVLMIVMIIWRKSAEKSVIDPSPKDIIQNHTYPDAEDELESMEFNEKSFDENDEKTMLLSSPTFRAGSRVCPILKYEDGRKIPITTFPFLIGKMKTRVDGVVEGAGVSRIHAMIKEQDGRYYISDLNSLNGTGINGKTLDSNETAEITEGDILSFANISLTFLIKAV